MCCVDLKHCCFFTNISFISAEEGTTKTQLVKSIAHTIKEKWGDNDYWNVIVTSTLEGDEGDNVLGSFPLNTAEGKYLKLQLGDHLYCEIWKAYSRTPATITSATTTTPTTTTSPVPTTPAITMEVKVTKMLRGVTDDEVDFLKKTTADVVASAEKGTSKTQLALSISTAIKKKWGFNGSWNVFVASTGDDVWGFFPINIAAQKYLKLQLGDHLYCEIWKVRGKYRNFS